MVGWTHAGAHDVPPRAAGHPDAQRIGTPVDLDADQRRVVDHESGPLLVLAGPGTGKTTTLVEAIADRIERRGADPSQVLALTFSRKAAESLRDRVTARLGRTTSTAMCSTFHSFAYGLVRAYSPADLYAAPLRLLSAPEQDVVLHALLTDAPESVRWPEALRAAVGTRGLRPARCSRCSRGPASAASTPPTCASSGGARAVPEFEAAGLFLEQYLQVLGFSELLRLRRPDRAAPACSPTSTGTTCAAGSRTSSSTSTRTPTPPRSTCSGRWPATVATSSSSATPTSRSTASAAPICAASSTSRPRSPPAIAPRLRSSRCPRRAASAPDCSAPRGRSPRRSGSPARSRPSSSARSATRRPTRRAWATAGSRCSRSTPRAPRPSTSRTCSAEPTSRTASAGRRWRCWCGRAAPRSHRYAAPSPGPGSPWRCPATRPRSCASQRCCLFLQRCGWSSTSTSTIPPTPTSSPPTGRRRC